MKGNAINNQVHVPEQFNGDFPSTWQDLRDLYSQKSDQEKVDNLCDNISGDCLIVSNPASLNNKYGEF